MKTYAWKRFAARALDGVVLCLPFLYVMIQVAESIERGLADSLGGSLVLSALGTASALIIEPFLLSKWGTTPGKWVMGLSVLKKDGSLLTHREALTRTAQVVTRGLGLCLRGLVFFTLAYQAVRLWIDKESSWDAQLDSACMPVSEFSFAPVSETVVEEDVSLADEEITASEPLLEETVAEEFVEAPATEQVEVEEENFDGLAIAEAEQDDADLEDPSIQLADADAGLDVEDDGGIELDNAA